MNKHLILLYVLSSFALILSLVSLVLSAQTPQSVVTTTQSPNPELTTLTQKVQKVEFFQEATRVSNNLIGFDQVYASLANDQERKKQCQDSIDLLKEWQDDVSSLKTLNTSYVDTDFTAQNFLQSIEKLNQEINADCTKLINEN